MLKSNLIANYVGQGWNTFMSLAFIPLYIKYIGIEAYGLIGLFALLQSWLNLLDMGMTPTLGREMARYVGNTRNAQSIRDLLRSIEIIALGIAIAIAVGIALSAEWIAMHWLQAEHLSIMTAANALTIMGIVAALRFIEGVYRSSIIGLQRQVLFNLINSAMSTLRGLGAVAILAWIAPTIEAFFLWQGVVSILTMILLGLATYSSLPKNERCGRFCWKSLQAVWSFAGGMTLMVVLTLTLHSLDRVLLSNLLSLTEFGYYALAIAISGIVILLVAPIAQAYYPKFCELHARNDTEALTIHFHKSAQLVSVTAGSVGIILALFAENLLLLWTQNIELSRSVAPLLTILVIANLINAVLYIPHYAQLAHGWTGLSIKTYFVSILLVLPAIFWAVPLYGAQGAAWVYIFLYIGYLSIQIPLMFGKILAGQIWYWYIDDVMIILTAALSAAAIVKISWPAQETIGSDILMVGFGSLATLMASAFSSKYVRRQASQIVKVLVLADKVS